MLHYDPPLPEFEFAINDWLDAPSEWRQVPAFANLDAAAARQVLEQAGRFATQHLLPLNAPGDATGCRWDGESVRTPAGYREAYRAFVDAGWPTLSCAPQLGGQGLPQVLAAAMHEMLHATCHGWSMYPGLAHGAYECLRMHGSAELQRRYLPKLVSGEWLSTMCLSEAQSGSDLSQLRTTAEPDAEAGCHRLTGTKIFISGGEHDLTDNIIHLVLARIAGAPAGTKGLSLFLVPKFVPEHSSHPRNAIRCIGIEHKMGLHGSATCTMSLEGARGWLIGQPGRGLAAMFVVMNAARLQVALQGLGHADITHQNALQHAQQRRQSRGATRPPAADSAPVPIIEHPAMQRLLLEQRAIIQGQRIMALWIAQLLDAMEHGGNAQRREQAGQWASLLTPIAKTLFTTHGFELSSSALQIFGGYGYVTATGIEQAVRDSRVAMIYEGTNQIQAIDLLARKVLQDGGFGLRGLLQHCSGEAAACAAVAECEGFGGELSRVIQALQEVVDELVQAAPSSANLAQRVADDFLWATGRVILAHVWARAARLSLPLDTHQPRRRERFKLAEYYFAYLLPRFEHDLRMLRIHAAAGFDFPWPRTSP